MQSRLISTFEAEESSSYYIESKFNFFGEYEWKLDVIDSNEIR